MGTWGFDPFDNDGAMDFLGELSDLGPGRRVADVASLLDTAQEPLADWSVETGVDEVLAAVAMVAANVPGGEGLRWNYVPEGLSGFLPTPLDESLVVRARVALDRLSDEDGWWMREWDPNDRVAVQGHLEELRAALGGRG
jgi:hypothetical protein